MTRWMLILGLLCWLGTTAHAGDELDAPNEDETSLTLVIEPLLPPRDFPNWHRSLVDGRSWIGGTAHSELKPEPPVGEFLIKPLKDALATNPYSDWDFGRRHYVPPALEFLDLKHDPEGVDPAFLRAVETTVTFANWPQRNHWQSRYFPLSEKLFGGLQSAWDWR